MCGRAQQHHLKEALPTFSYRRTMSQTARWVDGPVTVRSNPIPQWEWERHKEEICRKYRGMTLKDLVIWTKSRWPNAILEQPR